MTSEFPPLYDDSLPHYDSLEDAQRRIDMDRKEKSSASPGSYKEVGVQHFVRKEDSVHSLSLSYRVEPSIIRKANHLFSDNLLQGRSFVIIPGATVSLSAAPGEEEEMKVKLKKFMVAVKCTDYDMAKSENANFR